MLPEKVKKSNIAAGIWFISMFVLLAQIGSSDGGNIWDEGDWAAILVFSVHGISLFTALWYYAEAKGYAGILGIGLAFLSQRWAASSYICCPLILMSGR